MHTAEIVLLIRSQKRNGTIIVGTNDTEMIRSVDMVQRESKRQQEVGKMSNR